jgi:hypothetical protein
MRWALAGRFFCFFVDSVAADCGLTNNASRMTDLLNSVCHLSCGITPRRLPTARQHFKTNLPSNLHLRLKTTSSSSTSLTTRPVMSVSKATLHSDAQTSQANLCKQPGGGVNQQHNTATASPENNAGVGATSTPEIVKNNQRAGTAAGYKLQAKKDGIPFRSEGLFPPGDALLAQLSGTAGCWPFEKHLPGAGSPYEILPYGGWITGNAAAQRGIDLRMFYQEFQPSSGNVNNSGNLVGAVRFGHGAAIGTGDFYLSAHGGAIETCLDEATAELGKCDFAPFLATKEINFQILRPVPLHTTLLVKCKITQLKGIRCYVSGSIETVDTHEVLASCTCQLVDMVHFIK